MIALALSGGGSRAIAFHLGCLRALHERGILEKINVVSAVSGGSIITALYAYSDRPFEEFDYHVVQLLRRGLHWSIIRHLLSPTLFTRVVATNLISRPFSVLARILGSGPPFRRWASRTDALEGALCEILRETKIAEVKRSNLEVVFNACELRTGTAFRFGNLRSGSRRFGEIKDNPILVAHAVACSAAYPVFLPAFDRIYTFVRDGSINPERVVITDGGVYDNLGITCLEPGRNESLSLHAYSPEYIICCHAGHGQFSGQRIPWGFVSRMDASFGSIFRKVQDASLNRLHMHRESGVIKGFILPYLGQLDSRLPYIPADLVKREQVVNYPTNFAAMSPNDIYLISKRGEQLTRLLISTYCPEL